MSVTKLQGAYYVATGLWSLVHYRSFEAFTGRKRDPWLVRTVGLLAVVVGAGLIRHPGSRLARELADSSGAAFAIGDFLAVRSGQRRVYLADAAFECLLIGARYVGTGRPFTNLTTTRGSARPWRRRQDATASEPSRRRRR
jgi:hypothetical protein